MLPVLARRVGPGAGFESALREVYLLAAVGADVLLVKFVRENFFFFSTLRTITDKRL